MEELYRNLSDLNNLHWDRAKSLNADSFKATEIWLDEASRKTIAKTKDIHVPAVDGWLGEESQKIGPNSLSLIARFVWVKVDDKKCINVPRPVLATLKKSFGVELAYDYSISCINTITALPRRIEGEASSQAYSFCYLPKLAVIWSHAEFKPPAARGPITKGLILVTEEYEKPLRKSLEKPWSYGISAHAMFMALCISISFGGQIDAIHESIKESLRVIEDKTGYHSFQRGMKGPAPGSDLGSTIADELGTLSKDSNGSATKLASAERKAKMADKLIQFIAKNVDEEESRRGADGQIDAVTREGLRVLRGHTAVLADRLAMKEMDIEYTKSRLEVQINALFHLVTWNDSLSNLDLAAGTHEIAEASYRDALSMKTLAFVTMFFLPGSFVSSLFSTDLFEWDQRDLRTDDIGVKTTPQLRLYWAITIPLTLLTFAAYFAWFVYERRKKARRAQGNRAQTPVPGHGEAGTRASIAAALDVRRRATRLETKLSGSSG